MVESTGSSDAFVVSGRRPGTAPASRPLGAGAAWRRVAVHSATGAARAPAGGQNRIVRIG
jgi:hypothetical protein